MQTRLKTEYPTEVDDLRMELIQSERRQRLLIDAIKDLLVAANMIHDMPIEGAQALQFANEYTEYLKKEKGDV